MRVVAVINVKSKIKDAFTENDRALLEIIAHNVSSGIELVRSHEQELTSKQRQFDSLLENVESHGRGIRQSLRIPLQTLANAAYLMLKRPERSESYYNVITDNVSYCNEMLEDLWVNVKAGDLALQRVEFDELLNLSLVGVSGLERVQVVRGGLDVVSLIVDEERMMHVLHSLLQNAVDAMPEGGVVTVLTEVSSSGLVIVVQDMGVGVDKRDMVELFTPFYTTKPDGAGLGLSMCKQVVEAHGGSIRIEPEVELGCRVEVCLPVSVVDWSVASLPKTVDPKARLQRKK